MPRINLWDPRRNLDYKFADKLAGESLQLGGVGVLVHKYIGPASGGGITGIEDFLFLENRNRSYEDTVYEVKLHYTPEDVQYDLSQFGIFLSSDMRQITVHINDMYDAIGRKLISGDVLEFTNDKDTTIEGVTLNTFFVIQDALYSAPGFSMTWYPHLWKIRAKKMPASTEYSDILAKAATGDTAGGEGNGTGLMPPGYSDMVDGAGNPGPGCNEEILKDLSNYCRLIGVTDEVVKEAEKNAFYDPKFFETQHLYVSIDENTGYPFLQYWHSGDGVPPNGAPLKGFGSKFPDDMQDGEYFLRTDYIPDRLFQKQGHCYARIEDDVRKIWTAYNRRLDTYIDNINTHTSESGEFFREKQALSKVMSAKVDLNAENKELIKENQEKHRNIAKKLDGAE